MTSGHTLAVLVQYLVQWVPTSDSKYDFFESNLCRQIIRQELSTHFVFPLQCQPLARDRHSSQDNFGSGRAKWAYEDFHSRRVTRFVLLVAPLFSSAMRRREYDEKIRGRHRLLLPAIPALARIYICLSSHEVLQNHGRIVEQSSVGFQGRLNSPLRNSPQYLPCAPGLQKARCFS